MNEYNNEYYNNEYGYSRNRRTDINYYQGQERRSQNPERRSQNPDQRSSSPDRRSQGPERRSQSPDRRSSSSDRRSQGPDRRSQGPDRRSSNPDRRSQSPDRRRRMKERREKERRKRLIIQLCIKLAPYVLGLILIIVGLIFGIKALVKAFSKGDEAALETTLEETVSEDLVSISVDELILPEEENKSSDPAKYGLFEGNEVIFTSSSKTLDQNTFRSKYGIILDASTGQVLSSLNANSRMVPASMTKIMTLLVAVENVPEEKLDEKIVVSEEAIAYAWRNDCSGAGFEENEVVTVRDLLYGTILPSGGDAAYMLAVYVAGSHEAFVDMMNERLAVLGLADSAHFMNCVGIYNDNHYCTVADMAIILKEAISNELCRQVLSAHTYTTSLTEEHPEGIELSNWFLRRIEDKENYGTVIFAKTGYVSQSGNCAASYAEDPAGNKYICVTAGAESSWKCIFDHFETYDSFILN